MSGSMILVPLVVILVYTAICFAGITYLGRHHHDSATFECITKDAKIHWATHDNNLHVSVWCTKDGRIVP